MNEPDSKHSLLIQKTTRPISKKVTISANNSAHHKEALGKNDVSRQKTESENKAIIDKTSLT